MNEILDAEMRQIVEIILIDLMVTSLVLSRHTQKAVSKIVSTKKETDLVEWILRLDRKDQVQLCEKITSSSVVWKDRFNFSSKN